MVASHSYFIVKKSDLPENPVLNANLAATCAEWSEFPDKVLYEVISIHIGTNEIRRYPAEEAERIAIVYSHP
jgi:hypothetical protein